MADKRPTIKKKQISCPTCGNTDDWVYQTAADVYRCPGCQNVLQGADAAKAVK